MLLNLIIPILLTLPVVTAIWFWSGGVTDEALPWIHSLVWVEIGSLPLLLGISTWIALVRRMWLSMTILVLIYSLIMPILVAVSVSEIPLVSIHHFLWATAGLFFLSGSAVLAFAWQRFLQIEWGR